MRGSLVLASLLLCAPTAGPSVVAAEPTPAPSAALCLAVVKDLVPVDATADGKASLYAVTLLSLNGATGTASGTLSLIADRQRYDVPFKDAVAIGDPEHTTNRPMILVNLAEPANILGARIASLDGDSGGPCSPYTTWGHWVRSKATSTDLVAEATTLARTASPIAAPPPTDVQPLVCAGPDADVRATLAANPADPVNHRGSNVVDVEVYVTDDGTAAGATIYKSSTFPDLDQAAMDTALRSTYTPRIRHCRAMGAAHIFRADFEGDP
jgi:TonB family protein